MGKKYQRVIPAQEGIQGSKLKYEPINIFYTGNKFRWIPTYVGMTLGVIRSEQLGGEVFDY